MSKTKISKELKIFNDEIKASSLNAIKFKIKKEIVLNYSKKTIKMLNEHNLNYYIYKKYIYLGDC